MGLVQDYPMTQISNPVVMPAAFKIDAAAQYISVSIPTFRRLLKCGEIRPCRRVLRHVLVSRAELDRWVNGVEL